MKQKIFNESGKGYWMEGFGCLRAEGENRPSRPGHIVIALEGNGARPSHLGKGFSEDGEMFTLNTIEQHSVCYEVITKQIQIATDISPTLEATDYKEPHSICYSIENHPCDSRVTMADNGIVQTLNARMGTGGGNVPMVLMRRE